MNRYISRGYSLIELLITIVIIGILSSIAVPSYLGFMESSRRGDAKIGLQKMIAQQTRYFANNNGTYTTSVRDIGFAPLSNLRPTTAKSNDGHYELELATCDSSTALTQCVKITATAIDAQLSDEACRTLTINSWGAKSSANASGDDSTSICWE